VKHADRLNRISSLYVTGLDVLDGVEKLKICKKYKFGD
jgi:adenylosuccinate synthase